MTAPDRLSLVESRWREAGCGDEDKRWLIEQVKEMRELLRAISRGGITGATATELALWEIENGETTTCSDIDTFFESLKENA